MLAGKPFVALVALMSGFASVSAVPGKKGGCGCGKKHGSNKNPRDIEPGYVDLVPVSTRCVSRYGSIPRATPEAETRWKTHTACCITTSTCLASTTVTPATSTTTVTTTTTTTQTDPTVTSTATETSTSTETTSTTTTTDTTTTTTATETVSTYLVPTTSGFVPVQSSFPGSTYDTGAQLAARDGVELELDLDNINSTLSDFINDVGSALVRGLSKAKGESYLEGVFCDEYQGGCSTTYYTTCTTTYTATTPTTTVTTTETSTTTTTPQASTTTTVTTTTTSTVTETNTNTDTETDTTTVTAATLTAVYQACETVNFANTDTNGDTFRNGYGNWDGLDVTPAASADECCAYAFSATQAGTTILWAFDILGNTCYRPYFSSADSCDPQGDHLVQASTSGDLQLVIGNGNCGEWPADLYGSS